MMLFSWAAVGRVEAVTTYFVDWANGSDGGDKFFTATANVYNSLFVNNRSRGWGGGAYLQKAGRGYFINCTFIDNDGGEGGGIFGDSTDYPLLLPASADCVTTVYNSILWQNTDNSWPAGDIRKQLDELTADWTQGSGPTGPWPTADYSCIEGGASGTPPLTVYAGADQNIGSDPGIPVPGDEGTWDVASYDPDTGLTSFFDEDVQFAVGALEGHILLTQDIVFNRARSVIVSNTGDTIVVLGDLELFDADYLVEDYRIGSASVCRDVGDNTLADVATHPYDIRGTGFDRIDDITVDMGCYENED
jgi:hypothetical protein